MKRLLLVAALLGIVACSSERESAPGGPPFPKIGSAAPNIALPLFLDPVGRRATGSIVRLSDHRGEVVLLSFWSLSCAPCITELPQLVAFAYAHSGPRVHVYGVLMDNSPAEGLVWLREHGYATLPMLADDGQQSHRLYYVHGYPQMYLIGPDGRVAGHCVGCLDSCERYAAKLDSLLAS